MHCRRLRVSGHLVNNTSQLKLMTNLLKFAADLDPHRYCLNVYNMSSDVAEDNIEMCASNHWWKKLFVLYFNSCRLVKKTTLKFVRDLS